ncbi:MAG TPA: G/U mismatch-specific DNA glycosylase [Streptosporangiaceae bacterium]
MPSDARPAARRPSAAELAAAKNLTIPDLVRPGLSVLFSGINPSLYSAAVGYHFARPGNRFWPALHRSGFTARQLDPAEQEQILDLGLGITNVVARATARADELSGAELLAGGELLSAKVATFRPRWLAVVGVTAFRVAFGERKAAVGRQEHRLGATGVWVLPNPSGLNASWTVPRLTEAFRELKMAADDSF